MEEHGIEGAPLMKNQNMSFIDMKKMAKSKMFKTRTLTQASKASESK